MQILDNKEQREKFLEQKQKTGVKITNELNNGELVDKNSDILALVYGHICNPNGDPNMDDDVRYDYPTKKILITRACFHNMIRTELEGSGVKLFNSRTFKKEFLDKNNRVPTSSDRISIQIDDIVLDFSNGLEDFFTCIDRGFGGVVTNKKDKNEDTVKHFAAVSYDSITSLNKVERMAEEKVNAPFSSSSEVAKKQETFGKTNRVHYFITAVRGGVSKALCEKLFVTQNIVKMYDYSFVNSFCNIKSYKKTGMKCPFYIRVEYKDNQRREFIGNLNDYLVEKPKADKILCMDDFEVDINDLVEVLKDNKDIIHKIYYHEDSITRKIFGGKLFKELMKEKELDNLLVPIERPFQ